MVRVAKCPQCEHDLLVPDDAAASGLAKCPDCKSFFELENAETRKLPAVVLVDSEIKTRHTEPAPTEADLPSVETWTSDDSHKPAATPAAELDDDEPLELMDEGGEETPEAAAQRIDQWFRSAKTLSDVPPPVTGAAEEAEQLEVPQTKPAGARAGNRTIDVSEIHAAADVDSDFELDQPAESPHELQPWDDSHGIERLLAGIENEPIPAFDRLGDETTSATHEDHSAPAEEWSPDASMPVTPGRGEPRRKRSIVRTLVGTVVGGVVGLALAYYALLWIRGPEVDVLDLAKYLPKAALPASFRADAKKSNINPPSNMISDLAAADKAADPAPKTTEAPPEKQASFTAPVEPAKTETVKSEKAKSVAPADDRYAPPPAGAPAKTEPLAHEPAVLDTPPAKPLTETTKSNEPIHIVSAPRFTANELAASLQAAKDARPGLVTGKLSDGKEVQHAKGTSYSIIADLAQKATFAEGFASPSDAAKTNEQIEKLFRATLLDAHTREEIGQIVPKWIASPNRKHGGVFFAGGLTHQESKGTVAECSFDVGGGQSVVVMVPAAAVEKIGGSSRPVGIIGWIVDKPAEQIQGYTGSAPQAVFAKQLISLE